MMASWTSKEMLVSGCGVDIQWETEGRSGRRAAASLWAFVRFRIIRFSVVALLRPTAHIRAQICGSARLGECERERWPCQAID